MTTPLRDDTGTTNCPVCRRTFTPIGRQTYCASPCRKTAYRRRHQPLTAEVAAAVPTARSRREHTVYECPDCDQRLVGNQRCPDCGIFARRIGTGGPCPHCEEPVTITDLLDHDITWNNPAKPEPRVAPTRQLREDHQ